MIFSLQAISRRRVAVFLMSCLASLPSLAAEKVTVFAASSLTNALNEIGQRYEQQNQDVKVLFSFASSSALARQIGQGAPADLYLSANQKWMDFVEQKSAVNGRSRITLLKNSLVLIAPKKSDINTIDINGAWDILSTVGDSRLAVGDPDHVPVGFYAKQALQTLHLWKTADPLLARANNARGALVLVERAEASLGVVYATDARVAPNVKVVGVFPASSHKLIEYPLAMVSKTPNKATQDFYQYLLSAPAKSVFEHYGFGAK
ncbi:molybdate ABC transporter substrate-binding protein [Aliivibrio kagoshimensis]|uniref:molybdate ABC transporter substrate-binding protein n=1 Tax=Aliivibrio kagoshimensis TaxID=2910230 RepID=UPI003D0AA6B6